MKNQLALHLTCKNLKLRQRQPIWSFVGNFPGLPFILLSWLPEPFSSIPF